MLNMQVMRTPVLLSRHWGSVISGFQIASRGEQAKMVMKVLIMKYTPVTTIMILALYHMKRSTLFWGANKRRYCNRRAVLTRKMVGA